jgi:hypothetical protein
MAWVHAGLADLWLTLLLSSPCTAATGIPGHVPYMHHTSTYADHTVGQGLMPMLVWQHKTHSLHTLGRVSA